MTFDLSALLSGAASKGAAAGVLAVAASVVNTAVLRSDVADLTVAVKELRAEFHEMRRDLYTPKVIHVQPQDPSGPAPRADGREAR
jgi:hypothetical protein